jgi:ribosomal-protein-alanine N-acetyltransferase
LTDSSRKDGRAVSDPAPLELATARLRLVAASLEHARAALEGPQQLSAALGVAVPATFPPVELVDALRSDASVLRSDPAQRGWGLWLVIAHDVSELAGSAGFKGRPDRHGCVEIGYGIEPGRRGRGYATEAVGALVRWAWDRGVTRIVAECHRDNRASARVLTKLGMRLESRREPMLWWGLCRPR